MCSSDLLPGSDSPQRTVHFTGRVRLTKGAPQPQTTAIPEEHHGIGPHEVYRLYFHGPAYQVIGSAWRDGDGDSATAVARFAEGLPANSDRPTITGPRLIELCFQTAGVWELGTAGRGAHGLRIWRGRAALCDADERCLPLLDAE